jgi:large subunit ribosomal protein L10
LVQPEKSLVVKELKDKFRSAKTILLTDYRGLKVGELQELRSKLKKGEIEYKIIKNNLAKIALEELGLKNLTQYLEGPTAIAFGFKDPVDPAKTLVNFAKEHEKLKIKIGLLNGETLELKEISNLAALPSREVLLSKVIAGIFQPLNGLANVLVGPLRSLIYILGNIEQDRKREGGNNGTGKE